MAAQNSGKTAKARAKPRGRPFRDGESGNPGGRPKSGLSLVDNLRAALEQVDSETGRTRGEALAEKYVDLAEAGSVTAMENIIARFHGKPEQGIKLSGDEEKPLHIRVPERDTSKPQQSVGEAAGGAETPEAVS